ncbi:hypothetical protein [Xanthomonas phage RTH11]|nr:hypothetical protein [Xanthomonas phage RTH11]
MFKNIKPETKAVIAETARVALGISVVVTVSMCIKKAVEKAVGV